MALGFLALALVCLIIAGFPVRAPWSLVWLVLGAALGVVSALMSFGVFAVS